MTLDATEATTEETEPTDTTTDPAATETPEETQETTPEPTTTEDGQEAKGGEEYETPAEEPPAPKGKHQREGGWQRKISKLERQLEEKDALLAKVLGGQPPAPGKADATKDPAAQALDNLRALMREELAAERAREEQTRLHNEFLRRTATVRAAHPDFDEVISTLNVAAESPLGQALVTSEQGPAIMYALASNPDELARISALPPVAAIREIGRLEAKLTSSTAAPKVTPKAAPRKPAAPTPITPVTARGPTTVKPVSQMTQEEWNTWRNGGGGR
jgi:hypothetical protein